MGRVGFHSEQTWENLYVELLEKSRMLTGVWMWPGCELEKMKVAGLIPGAAGGGHQCLVGVVRHEPCLQLNPVSQYFQHWHPQ